MQQTPAAGIGQTHATTHPSTGKGPRGGRHTILQISRPPPPPGSASNRDAPIAPAPLVFSRPTKVITDPMKMKITGETLLHETLLRRCSLKKELPLPSESNTPESIESSSVTSETPVPTPSSSAPVVTPLEAGLPPSPPMPTPSMKVSKDAYSVPPPPMPTPSMKLSKDAYSVPPPPMPTPSMKLSTDALNFNTSLMSDAEKEAIINHLKDELSQSKRNPQQSPLNVPPPPLDTPPPPSVKSQRPSSNVPPPPLDTPPPPTVTLNLPPIKVASLPNNISPSVKSTKPLPRVPNVPPTMDAPPYKLAPKAIRRTSASLRWEKLKEATRNVRSATKESKNEGMKEEKTKYELSLVNTRLLKIWDPKSNVCGGYLFKKPIPDALKGVGNSWGTVKSLFRRRKWQYGYFEITTYLRSPSENYRIRYFANRDLELEDPQPGLDASLVGAIVEFGEFQFDDASKRAFHVFQLQFKGVKEPLMMAAKSDESRTHWVDTLKSIIKVADKRADEIKKRHEKFQPSQIGQMMPSETLTLTETGADSTLMLVDATQPSFNISQGTLYPDEKSIRGRNPSVVASQLNSIGENSLNNPMSATI